MAKILTRDEHGYINERGASKYWGVTTSKVGGERLWVVNFKIGGVTWGYRANGFKLKEVDAARIAAFLYEKGEATVNSRDQSVAILSADKKYVFKFDLNDTYIYREKAGNQKVYQFQPNLTLPLDDVLPPVAVSLGSVSSFTKSQKVAAEEIIETLAEPKTKAVDSFFKEKEEPSERELIQLITDAVLGGRVNPTAARILISVLEQAA